MVDCMNSLAYIALAVEGNFSVETFAKVSPDSGPNFPPPPPESRGKLSKCAPSIT